MGQSSEEGRGFMKPKQLSDGRWGIYLEGEETFVTDEKGLLVYFDSRDAAETFIQRRYGNWGVNDAQPRSEGPRFDGDERNNGG